MTMHPIIDLHEDYVISCYSSEGNEYQKASGDQLNFDLMKKGNVKVLFAGFSYDDMMHDSELQLETILNFGHQHKEFTIIHSWQEFETALQAPEKIGVVVHIEGADILQNSLDNLHNLYKKGLRSIGLTHNYKNCLGAGCKEDATLPLTDFGREVLKEAEELGMVVDLAHINEKGFYEVMELTKRPVIVTHGNSRAICNNPRNYTDDQIRAIVEKKGVIGVFFAGTFVRNDAQPTIDDVVRHYVHIAEVAGTTEILAMGSDFGGIITGLTEGLENMGKVGDLYTKLLAAGFTEKDIEGITHKNAERVISQLLV